MKNLFLLSAILFTKSILYSQAIEFQLLKAGNQGLSSSPNELVITSLTEAEEKLGFMSKEELSALDFEKNMLLAVFQGRCNSGGHKIYIENIVCEKDGFTVQVVHQRPGRKCYTTKALTNPFAVYVVSKKEGNWHFTLSKKAVDCR
jgi:hypothetical protein